MCIIAIKPKNKPIFDDETIEMMYQRNPHGAGIMYLKPDGNVHIEKGFFSSKDVLNYVHAHPELKDTDVVVNKRSKEIVIELDDGVKEVDISEFTKTISDSTGIKVEDLMLSVVTDESGSIICIVLYIDDDDKANMIVSVFNEFIDGCKEI